MKKRFWVALYIGAFLVGCSSSHKLTGTDFVDLSAGEIFPKSSLLPSEVVDSLGWGDLSSNTLSDVNEEFRFVLQSENEPFQLVRIFKKKKVKGESVIFWTKQKDEVTINAHDNMKRYLEKKCSEFFETLSYEYCLANYDTEPDWGRLFNLFESSGIWQALDESELEIEAKPEGKMWTFHTQVRLNNYYRSYSHSNPEQYPSLPEKTNVLKILNQLQSIFVSQKDPDNFNTYSGITTGKKGSAFILCDESEAWKFNVDLEELSKSGGIPITVEQNEENFYYITVSGTVDDIWYGNRLDLGFTREISPTELNTISVISNKKCPTL